MTIGEDDDDDDDDDVDDGVNNGTNVFREFDDEGTLINDDGRERISGMKNFLCIS